MDFVIYLFAGVFAVGLVLRYVVRRKTVFEFERGLLYRHGRFRRLLQPGEHWFLPVLASIETVDVRVRTVTVPGQEVLSSDSVGLKVSLAARYEVTDPALATHRVQNYEDALYQELQLATRELIGDVSADELLEQRTELSQKLTDATRPKAAEYGLELHLVNIKDIMFPGELKKMFAQVVKARKEGLAALEKARGETAALRHLANAARLCENNPALMQLRTLQTLGEGSGHTVVFGAPADSTPFPVRQNGHGGPADQNDGD